MRWGDLYVGLLAVVAGFGALVIGLQGAPWYGPAALAIIAAVGLAFMAARASRTPKVLLVGSAQFGRLNQMEDALEDIGYAVDLCPGPEGRTCPALLGRACPIRGDHEAAVVFDASTYNGPPPPCGRALGIPELTVEDGSAREPAFDGSRATVGSTAGVDADAAVLLKLLERTART